MTRTVWLADAFTPPDRRAEQLPPRNPPAPDAVLPDSLTISHARSLRGLPLGMLTTPAGRGRTAVHLDSEEIRVLLGTLRASSAAASARVADNARTYLMHRTGRWSPQHPKHVVTALHRILTRSRFLKGSRSCFPLRTAMAQIMPFVEAWQPVTILASGFPFKQHDNGLKTAGPWPDLAELGALLRLSELQRAFAALYPPGLQVVVLNDGGYSRPRASAEMLRYRRQLQRYAQMVGLGNSAVFHDQSCFVAGLLGPHGWDQRERYRHRFGEVIALLAATPCGLECARGADQRLAEALPADLLAGVPSFRDILSSLVYSVPVPVPPRTDPRRWACQVLAQPDEYGDPALSPELASARRRVLASAWRDTVNYLAASLADVASGVAQRYPPHVRLATVASRPGCSGFSYLGGSALLPWHGTGCLDGRGLLCAEFLVSLEHRGFLPVYSDGICPEQPLLLVPSARTVRSAGGRRVDPDLLASARLRPR
ncbi:MAG TPA: L-tyrosine/L-tryptophan isonitrile synthase family protein [Pseudonocardiaceae bacterium]|nr:L-tyrosine/L-tryptophan isonitrile synthase family protein [Pseudonocardiaceae bacterium]